MPDSEQFRADLKHIPTCEWLNREDEGSCNGCQRRDDPRVLCVALRNTTFRVCNACATELIAGLLAAVPQPSCSALAGTFDIEAIEQAFFKHDQAGSEPGEWEERRDQWRSFKVYLAAHPRQEISNRDAYKDEMPNKEPADTLRLDWLEQHAFTAYRSLTPETGKPEGHAVLVDERKVPRVGIVRDTLRDCIDAAMEGRTYPD